MEVAYFQGITRLNPHFFLFWQQIELFNAFFRKIIAHANLLIAREIYSIQTFNC